MPKVNSKKLHGITTCEEIIMNENFGNEYGKLRRERINYLNADGHSNIEGTLYFPANIDYYPVLDEICEKIAKLFEESECLENANRDTNP